MKVILLKSISKLGNAGDLVNVSPAYARNVLIKNKQAKPATKENVAQYQASVTKKEKLNAKHNADLKAAYKKLANAHVTFTEKTSEAGTLFAGIDEKQIAKKLSDTHQIVLDPHHVLLHEHIKTTGEHAVDFKLADDMKGAFKVIVKSKE